MLEKEFVEVLKRDQERKAREFEDIRNSIAASDIPLPDDLVQRILGLFPTDANKALQAHQGFFFSERRDHYRASLSIMYLCLDDLDKALADFERLATADKSELMLPKNRSRLEEIESRIQKELFTVAGAAASLVDHVRRAQKKFEVPDFNEQRVACFGDDGLHDLIIALRILLHHLHIVRTGWSISYGYAPGDKTAGFQIDRSELQRAIDQSGDRFKGAKDELLRKCVASLPKKIDLRDIFADYRKRLEAFYEWFDVQIGGNSPEVLQDYDRCVLEKERYSARMSWNALIGNWLNWERVPDVHKHLPDFLTEEQLDAVYQLPRNSKRQADLIIEFLDRSEAINDKLRERVHLLFEKLSQQEEQS